MVKRHAPSEFKFVCLTEDPAGIRPEVEIVPLPEGNDYELWWNKMYIFDMFREGRNLFFDLDVVIHGNLNYFFEADHTKPKFIYSHWKEGAPLDVYDTFMNSSVILFGDASYIWDKFQEDQEMFMSIYKGIDRFIWNEKIKVDFFPRGIVYSYWKENEQFKSDHSVCILNHNPKPHEIKESWIHEYWN